MSRAAQRNMLLRAVPSPISNVSTDEDIPCHLKNLIQWLKTLIVKMFICINFPCSSFVSCLVFSLRTSGENSVPSFLHPLLSWLSIAIGPSLLQAEKNPCSLSFCVYMHNLQGVYVKYISPGYWLGNKKLAEHFFKGLYFWSA